VARPSSRAANTKEASLTGPSPSAAVVVDHVRKAYGATVALDDVSFEVASGTAHALLGENGAGKSTLVKLLAGLSAPDTGGFHLFGDSPRLTSPRASHAAGLQTAFQEMTLVRDLTVLDNMLMPYAPMGPLGLVRRRRASREVADHFAEIGLEGVDLDAEIRDLDLAVQQKIEVARALYRRPRILLLDEPTSTLSGRDVDWLGTVIERQRARGVTVVFISHRLREVRDFCERVTVLRNGRHIATGRVADYGDAELISMIAGRSLEAAFAERDAGVRRRGAQVLRVDGLGTAGKLREASFALHEGEILGVAGLQGMGQLDMFLACFGVVEPVRGTIAVDGDEVAITSPKEAVAAKIGISLVPEDRKTEALFLQLTGRHNASVPVIDRFARFGLIDGKSETDAVSRVFDRVEIDRRALWTPVRAFSGGNQQKIAIAKWLLAESRCLLLYDPTRGIDVGTKNELYRLIRSFADAGGAVLFYSTEIPEIVHLADRAIVLYGGRIAAELEGDRLTEEAILTAALGSGVEDRRVA
jgi:ribose transport system ATP-binding protein